MSRTVETVEGAEVVYIDLSSLEEDGLTISDFEADFIDLLTSKFKSFGLEMYWYTNEVRCLLSNRVVRVMFSCYGNVGAVSIVPYNNMSIRFIKYLVKFIEDNYHTLRLVARFSNGEAYYKATS